MAELGASVLPAGADELGAVGELAGVLAEAELAGAGVELVRDGDSVAGVGVDRDDGVAAGDDGRWLGDGDGVGLSVGVRVGVVTVTG